jgi:hypothetical protein
MKMKMMSKSDLLNFAKGINPNPGMLCIIDVIAPENIRVTSTPTKGIGAQIIVIQQMEKRGEPKPDELPQSKIDEIVRGERVRLFG